MSGQRNEGLFKRFGRASITTATVAAAVVFLPGARVEASTAEATADASQAVRYDTSTTPPSVIGKILYGLFDEDDESEKVELPFPINFFGRKATHACVTTNGGIFPTDADSSCNDDYDYGIGDLAISEEAPFMAVLALDLDPGDHLLLKPDGSTDNRDVYYLADYFDLASFDPDDGVVTINSSGHGLLAGDHVSFAGTGTLLDSGNYPVTVIDSDNFSVPIVDPNPGSDDEPISLSDGDGSWIYSNGVGSRAVYAGTTQIDGRSAFVATWYRIPHNDDDNPQDRSSTLQLVLIKQATGSDADGWDFDVEYNMGTLTDDEDGYQFDDPSTDCTAWDSYPDGDTRDTCRWGMGFADYITNIPVASVVLTGGVGVITTDPAHGIPDTGIGVRFVLPDDLCLGDLADDTVWATVTSATTLEFEDSSSDFDCSGSSGAGSVGTTAAYTSNASNVYEFFGNSSIGDLIDSAGSTALVRNGLNTTVLGRYAFSMQGGLVKGFVAPSMTGGITTGGPSNPGRPGFDIDYDPYHLLDQVDALPNTGTNYFGPLALGSLAILCGGALVIRRRKSSIA